MSELKYHIIDLQNLKLNDDSVVTDMEELADRLKTQLEAAGNNDQKNLSPESIHFYSFFNKCLQEFITPGEIKKEKFKQAIDIGKSLFYLISDEDKIKIKNSLANNEKVNIKLHFNGRNSKKYIHIPWELFTLDKTYCDVADFIELSNYDNCFIGRILENRRPMGITYNTSISILIIDLRKTNDEEILKMKEDLKNIISGHENVQLKFMNILEKDAEKPSINNLKTYIEIINPNIIHFIGGVTDGGKLEILDDNNIEDLRWLLGKNSGKLRSKLLIFQQPKNQVNNNSNRGFEKIIFRAVKDGCTASSFIPYLDSKTKDDSFYLKELYDPILKGNSLEESFALFRKFYYDQECPFMPLIYFRFESFNLLEKGSQKNTNPIDRVDVQSKNGNTSNGSGVSTYKKKDTKERLYFQQNWEIYIENLQIDRKNNLNNKSNRDLETKLNGTRKEFKKYLEINKEIMKAYYNIDDLKKTIFSVDSEFCDKEDDLWTP